MHRYASRCVWQQIFGSENLYWYIETLLLVIACYVLCIVAQLTSWSLIMFGTATPPHYLAEYLSSRLPTVPHTRQMTPVLRYPSSNHTTQHNINITSTFASTSSIQPTSTDVGEYVYCVWELLLCVIIQSTLHASAVLFFHHSHVLCRLQTIIIVICQISCICLSPS